MPLQKTFMNEYIKINNIPEDMIRQQIAMPLQKTNKKVYIKIDNYGPPIQHENAIKVILNDIEENNI